MKTLRSILIAACLLAAATAPVRAQNYPPGYVSGGQPNVLTKEQAQAQSKSQMAAAQVQYIGILERGFDQLSNIVTANSYHLSQAEVIAGFGDSFNGQVLANGRLLLSTIIKANVILGRSDKWLAQEWVVGWINAYKLDPATGDPLPAQ